jgi:GH15 family glucan-1,4-alpha-glucosidase
VLENGFEPGQHRAIRRMLEFLETAWSRPDEGIWEIRGPRRHFTYSKVMAWAAFDRALKLTKLTGRDGPAARWRAIRDQIHRRGMPQRLRPSPEHLRAVLRLG